MASILHRPWRLDLPSHVPIDEQEAVELADLTQALVADAADPSHSTFTASFARWRDRNSGVIESDRD